MSKAYVPLALRRRVVEQARYRCGYCQTLQQLSGMMFTVEHIFPEARGGATDEDNLWLACADCNQHKGDRFQAADPISGATVRLFDPRHQQWSEHFAWSQDGLEVVGLTPVGRATIGALKLNRSILVNARRNWVKLGAHPPENE